MQNDEHLFLITVIGVGRDREREREGLGSRAHLNGVGIFENCLFSLIVP